MQAKGQRQAEETQHPDTNHGSNFYTICRYLHASRHCGRDVTTERLVALGRVRQSAAVFRTQRRRSRIGIRAVGAEAERPCTQEEGEGGGRLV